MRVAEFRRLMLNPEVDDPPDLITVRMVGGAFGVRARDSEAVTVIAGAQDEAGARRNAWLLQDHRDQQPRERRLERVDSGPRVR